MDGGGGGSIPEIGRKTIELIREITRKQHSDDEIYSVLKECNMDPNETAQKLMFLDTFHEVRRKRDKRKESIRTRSQEFGPTAVAQRRGERDRRGSYSSYNVPAGGHDVAGRRTANGWRQNGITEIKEGGFVPSSAQISQRTAKISTVTSNAHRSLFNGSSSHAHSAVSSSEKAVSASYLHAATVKPLSSSALHSTFRVETGNSAAESNYSQASSSPASATELKSASDPLLIPSNKPLQLAVVGTIQPEVGAENVAGDGDQELKSAKVGSLTENSVHLKTSQKIAVKLVHTVEESQLLDSLTIAMDSANIDDNHSCHERSVPLKVLTAEGSSQDSSESNVSNSHHVTFPSNFQVPEGLRKGLTFGSFKVSFGGDVMHATDSLYGDCESATVKLPQETPEENSRRSSSTNDLGGELPDQSPSPQQRPEEKSPSEDNIASGVVQDYDQPKQDSLVPSEGRQYSAFHGDQNNNFGLVPNMIGHQQVQLDRPNNQLQDASTISNYMATSNQAPTLTQSGVTQSSLSISPPPHLPLFSQPYPSNYFPYSHYIPMVMPPMQQFLSPNGLPQQASSSNLYMQSQFGAAGNRYPVPQFEPGANVANPAPFGVTSAYGSYGPTFMGYNLGPTLTTGSSAGNEDLAARQPIENHSYTATQLNEGSAAWIPQAGHEMAGIAVNSSYSMLPQNQHVTYSSSQPIHGPYAGILQPQAINAPSEYALLQQSQAVAGTIEPLHPQPGIYPQAHHSQMWNTNFSTF